MEQYLSLSDILEDDNHIFDVSGVKDPHSYLYFKRKGIWYPVTKCISCTKAIDIDNSVLCQKCEDKQVQNEMSDLNHYSQSDYGRI